MICFGWFVFGFCDLGMIWSLRVANMEGAFVDVSLDIDALIELLYFV